MTEPEPLLSVTVPDELPSPQFQDAVESLPVCLAAYAVVIALSFVV